MTRFGSCGDFTTTTTTTTTTTEEGGKARFGDSGYRGGGDSNYVRGSGRGGAGDAALHAGGPRHAALLALNSLFLAAAAAGTLGGLA